MSEGKENNIVSLDTGYTPKQPPADIVSGPRSIMSYIGDCLRMAGKVRWFEVHDIALSVVGIYHPSSSYVEQQPVFTEAFGDRGAALAIITFGDNDFTRSGVTVDLVNSSWLEIFRQRRSLSIPEARRGDTLPDVEQPCAIPVIGNPPYPLIGEEMVILSFLSKLDDQLQRFTE